MFRAAIKVILFVILFAFCNCNKSDDTNPGTEDNPVEIIFAKTLGGSKNEVAQSVIKTNDGGYAIAGYTQSTDMDIEDKESENFDFWFLKFDAEDNLIHSKTLGGSNNEKAYKIISSNDNGYVLTGTSNSNDNDVSENFGLNDIWLVKLDASGSIVWEKTHGFQGNDESFSVISTSDGGYFVSGILDVTASEGEGNDKSVQKKHAGGDYWALKLDANGDKVWRRYFGGTFSDTSYDAIETEDHGFIMVGSSDSFDFDVENPKGSYDFWVVKVNAEGDLEWENSYGGTQIDEARSIVKTSDGNYLIAGDTRSNDGDVSNHIGAADVWVIKISPTGTLLWDRSYGGSSFDAARHISATQDNGFIITGSSRSENIDVNSNKGENDVWILKIDNSGNLQWQQSLGGSKLDFAYSAAEMTANNFIIVGESSSSDFDIEENNGFSDLLIIKIKYDESN